MISIKTEQPSNIRNKFLPLWKQHPNGTHSLESPYANNNTINTIKENSIKKGKETEEKKGDDFIDMSEKIKKDAIVNTEWGPGKIISVDKANQTCKIKIENEELSFPLMSVNPSLNIYACIIDKSKTNWAMLKVTFQDTSLSIKQKIAKMYQVHHSQIILIHAGVVISDNKGVFDIGLFENDDLLIVIKDKKEFAFKRFKSIIINTQNSGYNSIFVKANDNIILTGIGFFKNTSTDVYYELIIKDSEKNVLYTAQNILVKNLGNIIDMSSIDNLIVKYKLGEEVVFNKDKVYEIQQNLNVYSSNSLNQELHAQCIGYQTVDGYNAENGLKLTFTESSNTTNENGKQNMTSVTMGMIPALYYAFKI